MNILYNNNNNKKDNSNLIKVNNVIKYLFNFLEIRFQLKHLPFKYFSLFSFIICKHKDAKNYKLLMQNCLY